MQNYRVFGSGDQYKFSQNGEPFVGDMSVKEESSPIMSKIAEQQKKALIPLKEDLADWISKLTGQFVC